MHRCKKRSRSTLRSFCSLLSAGAGAVDGEALEDLLVLVLLLALLGVLERPPRQLLRLLVLLLLLLSRPPSIPGGARPLPPPPFPPNRPRLLLRGRDQALFVVLIFYVTVAVRGLVAII